jgi:hypothetical protein
MLLPGCPEWEQKMCTIVMLHTEKIMHSLLNYAMLLRCVLNLVESLCLDVFHLLSTTKHLEELPHPQCL